MPRLSSDCGILLCNAFFLCPASVKGRELILGSLQIDCLSGIRVWYKSQLTGWLDHILSQNLLELFLSHELFEREIAEAEAMALFTSSMLSFVDSSAF